MQTLSLTGTNGVSDIHIETGLLGRAAAAMLDVFSPSRAHIVTDSTVAPLSLEALERQFSFPVSHTVIPAGEEYKRLATVETVYHDMLAAGMTRKDLVIALGGGVVGDITGFAAATFLRGIALCQIPTTLLAQVDSSVGGKTGVDLAEGKNLVGAFYQPRLVLIDPAVLVTLPDATFADGMAEVVKYGYIANKGILDLVALPDYKARIGDIIYECVKIKRDVVAIDEHEPRLIERADEVFALGQINTGLAADRGIHLREQRGRNLAQRHTAQEGRRGKAGDVADNTAAERDNQILAGHAGGQQIMVNAFDRGKLLVLLTGGNDRVRHRQGELLFQLFEIQRRYR